MNCPHCAQALVCAACGARVESGPAEPIDLDEEPAVEAQPQTFLVVAKGHGELLEQLREVVGELGWVKLIKDRRDDPTILPREGRQGTVRVDQELSP